MGVALASLVACHFAIGRLGVLLRYMWFGEFSKELAHLTDPVLYTYDGAISILKKLVDSLPRFGVQLN